MKSIIIFFICCGLTVGSVLSFADDKQKAPPEASPRVLAQEKATFNHDEEVYNNKKNKDTRAKRRVSRKTKSDEQYLKKVQTEQDVNKGQVIVKF